MDALDGHDFVIGFQDESSPQTTANTVRLWSPSKPTIMKNIDKLRANLFGFYPINGNPDLEAPESSKTNDMVSFLSSVRSANGGQTHNYDARQLSDPPFQDRCRDGQ